MEYPSQLGHGLSSGHYSSLLDQHWLPGCPVGHRITDNHLLDLCLHSFNRLRAPEAYPGRAPATSPMDAWPLRHGRQYSRFGFLASHLRLFLLPVDEKSRHENNELECGNVPCYAYFCVRLLLTLGPA